MFKEGSKVFGGEVSLDTDVKSLKLETQEVELILMPLLLLVKLSLVQLQMQEHV